MKRIDEAKCFILDLDGTIYLGDEIIDGAVDFINKLNKENKKFIFLTNNSSKNNNYYKEKLKSFGIYVSNNSIFTSGEATTIYLNSRNSGSKVFLIATNYLKDEFIRSGFNVTNIYEEDIDFVVLGFDTTLTYNKLWIACDLIREGVEFIATHPDINCPLEDGKFMPDAGAIIEFIYASTGKRPNIIGNPNTEIINCICKKYRINKEDMIIVGDRLYTDIKTGINSGITSILVLSGETKADDYSKSNIKADFVYNSVKEIINELNNKYN